MTTQAEIQQLVQAELKRRGIEGEKQLEQQTFLGGALRAIGQGGSFGFSDEIGAPLVAAFVAGQEAIEKGANPIEVFQRELPLMLESIRGRQQEFREVNPKTNLALEVAGGALTGGAGVARATGANTGKQVLNQVLRSSLGKQAAVGGAAGATAGVGFADKDKFLSIDRGLDGVKGAGVGAAFGVIAPRVINSSVNTIKRILRKRNVLVGREGEILDAQGFTDEAIEALQDLVDAGELTTQEITEEVADDLVSLDILTPEQAARFNLFQRRNVPAFRADITRKTSDARQLRDVVKTSGPAAERLAAQDKRLIELAQEGVENLKPAAADLVETNSRVFQTIANTVNDLDEITSQAYQVAKRSARGREGVQLNKLMNTLNNNRGNERVTGGIISAARQLLRNKGLERVGNKIDINKRGTRVSGSGLKRVTVNEAEEIRQGLNSLFEGANPQGRILIRRLKDAIDDDVASTVGEDVFAPARAARTNFARIVERGRRDKFDKSRRSFLEDVINNKVPEDKIVTKLLTGADDDFLKFKRFLTKDAGAEGVQAWNDIKAQVLRNALGKATRNFARREGGQQVFSAVKFRDQINVLKQSKKYNALFNGDEKRLIDDIIEIGELRAPIESVPQGSGPSGGAIQEESRALFQKIMEEIPVIGKRAQAISRALQASREAKRQLDPLKETIETLQGRPQ